VLRLNASWYANGQIAALLPITEETVKIRVKNVIDKRAQTTEPMLAPSH